MINQSFLRRVVTFYEAIDDFLILIHYQFLIPEIKLSVGFLPLFSIHKLQDSIHEIYNPFHNTERDLRIEKDEVMN